MAKLSRNQPATFTGFEAYSWHKRNGVWHCPGTGEKKSDSQMRAALKDCRHKRWVTRSR